MEQELIDYYKKIDLDYYILTAEEKNHIKQMIERLYIRKNAKYGFSLFDMLKIGESVAVNFYDSWSWINDFIKDKKVIVFFDYKEGEYIELSNGSAFIEFYDNCPKDEFYMTDTEGNYLLGYNHSHCLFAMGIAADWLESEDNYINFYKQ